MDKPPTFSVKNFEKFQHYKDRNPPWIKFYNCLLDDYQLSFLTDAEKWHLASIWLLASRYQNATPADEAWIQKRIGATEPIKLQKLIDLGFIVMDHDCSILLANCKQNAKPETEESRVETEREKKEALAAKAARSPKSQQPLKGTRLEDDWRPSAANIALAVELGIDIERTLADFLDYWIAKPGKDGLKLDWQRTWNKWCRNQNPGRTGGGRLRGGQRGPESVTEATARVAAFFARRREQNGEPGGASYGNGTVPANDGRPEGPQLRHGVSDGVVSRGLSGGISNGRDFDGVAVVVENATVVADPVRTAGRMPLESGAPPEDVGISQVKSVK